MKTTPARWYRDRMPQVDGWPLHCLLAQTEPAVAALVEPFRDIITGLPGPPPPCKPPLPPLEDYFVVGS